MRTRETTQTLVLTAESYRKWITDTAADIIANSDPADYTDVAKEEAQNSPWSGVENGWLSMLVFEYTDHTEEARKVLFYHAVRGREDGLGAPIYLAAETAVMYDILDHLPTP